SAPPYERSSWGGGPLDEVEWWRIDVRGMPGGMPTARDRTPRRPWGVDPSTIESSFNGPPPHRSRDGEELGPHPRHMTHLPAGARFALTVDVHVKHRVGDELGPAVHVIADEIVHHRAASDEVGRAGRKVADRADVLFELRGDRAFDRPVPAVVHARRDLVDQRPVAAGEEFD